VTASQAVGGEFETRIPLQKSAEPKVVLRFFFLFNSLWIFC